MKTLATLGKYNRNRGVITWRFCKTETGEYLALRNDGRRFSYLDIDDARDGYRKMRSLGFAQVELLAV